MKKYVIIILLMCITAILLFSYFSSKDSAQTMDGGYVCPDGSDSCTIARICRSIKDIKHEYMKNIEGCLKICNGIDDDFLCIPQIATLSDYPCKDGSDSCAIAKIKKELLESLNEITSKREKVKLQCDVFGCNVAKDSSFFMITDYDIISRYNKKYLLVNSDEMSIVEGLLGNPKRKESIELYKKVYLPNNDSQYVSKILSDCTIENYESPTFSEESNCDLNPLITKLPSNTDFFCFRYYFDNKKRYYTLMKENNAIDKILKLKSENLAIHSKYINIERFQLEKYRFCLYYLGLARVKYGYDIIYIHSFDNLDICDVNRWRGVRLKEQSKKDMSLKSLFVVPKSCYSY